MHLPYTLRKLSLLNLILHSDLDKLLVILVIILGEFLFVIIFMYELNFGFVFKKQLFPKLLWLLTVDRMMIEDIHTWVNILRSTIVGLLAYAWLYLCLLILLLVLLPLKHSTLITLIIFHNVIMLCSYKMIFSLMAYLSLINISVSFMIILSYLILILILIYFIN